MGGLIKQIEADHVREDPENKRLYFCKGIDDSENDSWFKLEYVRGILRLETDIPDHIRNQMFGEVLADIGARPWRPPSETGDLMDNGEGTSET